MKRGRLYGRIVKHIVVCIRNLLRIAINICQTVAVHECTVADAGYTIRDSDRSQASTTREGIITDAGHTIVLAVVGNRSGNDYRTRIIRNIITLIPQHFSLTIFISS